MARKKSLTPRQNTALREATALLLEREGLTQAQMAERLGIAQQTLSNFLNHRSGASEDVAAAIMKVAGVTDYDALQRLVRASKRPPATPKEDSDRANLRALFSSTNDLVRRYELAGNPLDEKDLKNESDALQAEFINTLAQCSEPVFQNAPMISPDEAMAIGWDLDLVAGAIHEARERCRDHKQDEWETVWGSRVGADSPEKHSLLSAKEDDEDAVHVYGDELKSLVGHAFNAKTHDVDDIILVLKIYRGVNFRAQRSVAEAIAKTWLDAVHELRKRKWEVNIDDLSLLLTVWLVTGRSGS